jgi:hypothetical protein
MPSIINAGTTTATALNMITDTSGALTIQTSGVNAISITSSQVVSLTNALLPASGGTGVTSLGTGVATALGQNVTGSGSIVLAASPTLTGTPLAPTATVGTNTTQIATTAFVLANAVPSGVILLWSGSVASIPSGWLLCNGTSGTPDLRNRFIVGAGSTYNPGNTGGSADATLVSHNHTATSTVSSTTHNHQTQGYADNSGSGVGFLRTSQGGNLALINTTAVSPNVTVSTTIANAGSSATNANLPPYYALAYIMKS